MIVRFDKTAPLMPHYTDPLEEARNQLTSQQAENERVNKDLKDATRRLAEIGAEIQTKAPNLQRIKTLTRRALKGHFKASEKPRM